MQTKTHNTHKKKARSTNLYTIFEPPLTLRSEFVPSGGFIDRHFEDGVYPACDIMERLKHEEQATMNHMNAYVRAQQKHGDWSGVTVAQESGTIHDSSPGPSAFV